MKDYLIHFVQRHPTFRRPELESLAQMNGIDVDLSAHRNEAPYLVCQLENDEQARKLIERSILTKEIYELWGEGNSMEEMHSDIRDRCGKLNGPFVKDTFMFKFEEFQGPKISQTEQIKLFDELDYLGLQGKIRLRNPQQTFVIMQEFAHQDDKLPSHCYFGRQVASSIRMDGIVDKYEISKRPYYGTTTFEAELSLVTCNIGLVQDGQFVYDPFVGTGAFALAAAAFGGLSFGSDIDFLALKGGRPAKSDNRMTRLEDNFKYYGTETRFGDVMCMDFTNSVLRDNLQFDSIVCDPPYGLREGLRVCGTNDEKTMKNSETVVIDGQMAYLRREYIQPKKPYSLDAMLDDLLEFAAKRLPVGGRLCFWMPKSDSQDFPTLVPQHERLELLYDLEQPFNKWSRRLLAYEKRGEDYKGRTVRKEEREAENNFRERYFASFSKEQKRADADTRREREYARITDEQEREAIKKRVEEPIRLARAAEKLSIE